METTLLLKYSPYDVLYKNMIEKIKDIQQSEGNLIKHYQLCQDICKETLQQLKEQVLVQPFTNEEEEVLFFKHIKPSFYSHLIYFIELHNITLRCPIGNRKVQEVFFTTEYYRIKFTFDTNVELYHYYRNEETYLDAQFYLRNKRVLNKSMDYIYTDESSVFATGYDYMVARFMAYERLCDYLDKALLQLRNANEVGVLESFQSQSVSSHNWTASKVALAELIYALHATKAIDGGTINMKKLADLFSTIFPNIKFSNIYKVLEEIRLRKKDRTPFLNLCLAKANAAMDEDDERAA